MLFFFLSIFSPPRSIFFLLKVFCNTEHPHFLRIGCPPRYSRSLYQGTLFTRGLCISTLHFISDVSVHERHVPSSTFYLFSYQMVKKTSPPHTHTPLFRETILKIVFLLFPPSRSNYAEGLGFYKKLFSFLQRCMHVKHNVIYLPFFSIISIFFFVHTTA